MRFSTLLSPLCWMKRVISLAPIEKPCQLMMVLGVFVIENRLPCWLKLACPATTFGATGLACAALMKQAATTATSILRCKGFGVRGVAGARWDERFFMVFNLFKLSKPDSGGCAGGCHRSRRWRRRAARGHNRAADSCKC